MPQVTTLLFVKYDSFLSKSWAFGMMQFAHRPLIQVEGQVFYKLMGSGKGHGFNPWPDWSMYALLQVWSSEAAAEAFFENHSLIQAYKSKGMAWRVFWLKTIQAHGYWAGLQPFVPDAAAPKDGQVAIITRATIRPSMVLKFWKYVPTTAKAIEQASGLLFTKGIGEVPVFQMATFSQWEDMAAVKEFAYKQSAHREAIHLTKSLNWYEEELFARFYPFKITGNWPDE